MAANSIARTLVLVVLALAMGGFGLCALCGGVMGISELSSGRNADLTWTIFMLSAIGAAIAVLCGWGIHKLRRRDPP